MKNKTKEFKLPTSTNLKQFKLEVFIEGNEKGLSEEEFKFLIDKSILTTFGLLEANKIKYLIKKENSSKYILKTYEK